MHRDPLPPLSRRDMLHRMGAGFGTLGLAGMIAGQDAARAASDRFRGDAPLRPKASHFSPAAKHIIQLFMPGGPSHVDTFDYKPQIKAYEAQRPEIVDRKSLRNTKNGLFPSPLEFRQYGECGQWVSDIFPHVAECVDDRCFIHSMHTELPEHAGAILISNLGHLQPNRPSLGSWLVYGLGTENQDLPGFVAMSPRAQPRGALANWGNAFLPGTFAGTYVSIEKMQPDRVLANLGNQWRSPATQRKQADLLSQLNRIELARQEQDQQLEP